MSNRQVRKDRLIKEHRHDPYQERGKWPEPTRCTACGAIFAGGRWTWQPAPEHAHQTICPACRRTADNFPAGTIQLEGPFFQAHRQEISNLVQNEEQKEKSERPLERIIAIKQDNQHALITTTGVHVARRIGQALVSAYNGELSFNYADEERNIRVIWRR